MFQRVGWIINGMWLCSAGVLSDLGVFCGVVFGGVQGGLVKVPGVLLQVPGPVLTGFQSVSKYKLFSPGIQVELFFLDFGVFQNAAWISRSTSRLRVALPGFEA